MTPRRGNTAYSLPFLDLASCVASGTPQTKDTIMYMELIACSCAETKTKTKALIRSGTYT